MPNKTSNRLAWQHSTGEPILCLNRLHTRLAFMFWDNRDVNRHSHRLTVVSSHWCTLIKDFPLKIPKDYYLTGFKLPEQYTMSGLFCWRTNNSVRDKGISLQLLEVRWIDQWQQHNTGRLIIVCYTCLTNCEAAVRVSGVDCKFVGTGQRLTVTWPLDLVSRWSNALHGDVCIHLDQSPIYGLQTLIKALHC